MVQEVSTDFSAQTRGQGKCMTSAVARKKEANEKRGGALLLFLPFYLGPRSNVDREFAQTWRT